MQVIMATWYDETNQPFLTELFESHLDEQDIFTFYEEQKAVYGRQVIASYMDTRVFSDGSRVILQLHNIKKEVETTQRVLREGAIDVEAGSVTTEPPRIPGKFERQRVSRISG